MVGSLPYIPTAQVLPITAALLACSVAGSVADALSWQVTLLLLLDMCVTADRRLTGSAL